jgi:hypothetical protein
MAKRSAAFSRKSRETLKRNERAREDLRATFERIEQQLRRKRDEVRQGEGAVEFRGNRAASGSRARSMPRQRRGM